MLLFAYAPGSSAAVFTIPLLKQLYIQSGAYCIVANLKKGNILTEIACYSENQLLLLLKAHSEPAFGELYRRYWQALYDEAFKRLKDHASCKDIVQDIFTDLWARRTHVSIDNLGAYLHTSTRYRVYRTVSSSVKNTAFFELYDALAEAPFDADRNIKDKELGELVSSWMKTLPKKRRKIFQLFSEENLTTAQIAARLGISQKTVQNQLGRASKSLTEHLLPAIALLLTVSDRT